GNLSQSVIIVFTVSSDPFDVEPVTNPTVARDDMYMDVEHRLAGARFIVVQQVDADRTVSPFDCAGNLWDRPEQVAGDIFRQLVNVGRMHFWNDERMPFRHLANVQKSVNG